MERCGDVQRRKQVFNVKELQKISEVFASLIAKIFILENAHCPMEWTFLIKKQGGNKYKSSLLLLAWRGKVQMTSKCIFLKKSNIKHVITFLKFCLDKALSFSTNKFNFWSYSKTLIESLSNKVFLFSCRTLNYTKFVAGRDITPGLINIC